MTNERLFLWIEHLNCVLSTSAVPLFLMALGGFYLFYLRAFYVRHPIRTLRAMLRPERESGTDGISPFRSVTLALAGTLGVGNLVGVASAIALGGAGALFWMLLSAFLAMLLKYAEIVLALRHRRTGKDGTYYGGAMYYMRDFLARIGLKRLGAGIAGIFAVLCVMDSLTMGCIIQMNAVGSAFYGVFSVDSTLLGILLALVTLLVISGGGRRIAAITERLVPFMTLLYIILSVAVLLLRWERIPSAIRLIQTSAFTPQSAAGGAMGFFSSRAVRYGTMRGLMSNEAGCGTAPIAHAASNAKHPAEQGVLGIFEVFVDTILLCTLTGLVILVGYDAPILESTDAMMMTIGAYSGVLGGWSAHVMTVMVLFFAFATVICWAHYGRSALAYLTPHRGAAYLYHAVFCVFVWYGCGANPAIVFTVSDLALGIMTVLNLIFLLLMRREVKAETVLLLERERA